MVQLRNTEYRQGKARAKQSGSCAADNPYRFNSLSARERKRAENWLIGFKEVRERRKKEVAPKKILERDIEAYLRKCIHSHDGVVRKLSWIGKTGAPDRLVMLNGPHFVELKRPGGKPTAGQLREHGRMRKHGLDVYVLSTFEEVDEFVNDIVSLGGSDG